MSDERRSSTAKPSFLRRFLFWATGLLVLAGLGGWAGFELWNISGDLRDARNLLDTAAEAIQDGDMAEARNALDRAEALLVDANDALHGSVPIDAVAWIPGVSHNLRTLEDSIQWAMTLTHGGVRIIEEASPLEAESGTLEVSMSDGTFPIDAIVSARDELSQLLVSLTTMPKPRDSALVAPPLRDVRESVIEEADRREQQLRVLNGGLELVEEFSGAHRARRYLLAVANTAEMRGSGGMILNYGVLEGEDGTVDLTAFGRVDEVALATPVSEELVPPDYLARWSGFDQLRRWRQANLSGDFTVVAPVLEAMFVSATALPVDGVIQVDPEGLAAILEGVGPVQVEEIGEVDADNVVDITMHEAYVRFPGVEERSDVLGDVAEATFRRLVDGEIPSLRTLATAIASAVDGRHIVVHSRTPQIQRRVVEFGADGAFPRSEESKDVMALSAQNLSGNKLDYFLETDLTLTGTRVAGEAGELAATITLSNTAQPGATEPRYVYGPGFTEASPAAGVLRSLVTLYLPVGTAVDGADGDEPNEPVATGTEAGRPYVSFTYDVPAGESRELTVSLRLAPRPSGPYELQLVPSPFIRPTTATVDIATGPSRVDAAVALDRTWIVAEDRAPAGALAPIYQPRGSGQNQAPRP